MGRIGHAVLVVDKWPVRCSGHVAVQEVVTVANAGGGRAGEHRRPVDGDRQAGKAACRICSSAIHFIVERGLRHGGIAKIADDLEEAASRQR